MKPIMVDNTTNINMQKFGYTTNTTRMYSLRMYMVNQQIACQQCMTSENVQIATILATSDMKLLKLHSTYFGKNRHQVFILLYSPLRFAHEKLANTKNQNMESKPIRFIRMQIMKLLQFMLMAQNPCLKNVNTYEPKNDVQSYLLTIYMQG